MLKRIFKQIKIKKSVFD